MTKRRLAVTISPKLKRRNDLVTVVPLSATAPAPLMDWHLEIAQGVPDPWGPGPRWAKADMVATVCFDRLSLPYSKDQRSGRRRYHQIELDADIVGALRRCIAAALGM